MFNLKWTAIVAGVGFVLSFFTGLIAGAGFLSLLLRGILCAVLFGALFSGGCVLYKKFLDVTNESYEAPVREKTTGTMVDITLGDEELPDEDSAPDFVVDASSEFSKTPVEKPLEKPGEVLQENVSKEISPEKPPVVPESSSNFSALPLKEIASSSNNEQSLSKVSDLPDIEAVIGSDDNVVEEVDPAQMLAEESPVIGLSSVEPVQAESFSSSDNAAELAAAIRTVLKRDE